ncbi:MAG TPA: VCBS repeat-containing protein, partial [Acidobacteriota bacterium]|nr:VCBS repeat-containing protein [Acidobacteriota bacterium]
MNRLRSTICACVLFAFFSLTLFASSPAKKPPEINARESASISPELRPAFSSSPVIQQPVENPWQNLTAHRTLSSGFSSGDQPLSAASADFNEDGVPDLVLSSDHAGSGLITAFPGDGQTRLSLKNDRSPFLAAASRTALDEAATWIGAGDFNADDHADVVAVRKGSPNIYWLEGDGHGGFRNLHTMTLEGPVTAMVVGEINRADHLPDVVIAIQGRKGPQILVFESPLGAMQGEPEKFDVSDPVTSLALGQLDDSYEYDLAAAAGSRVLIIHGRDRKLTQGSKRQAEVKPAVIDSIAFSSPVNSIAVGNFVGDNKQDIAVLSVSGSLQILERGGTAWKHDEVKAALSGSSTLLAGFVSGGPHQNLIAASAQEGLQALNSSSGSLSLAALG